MRSRPIPAHSGAENDPGSDVAPRDNESGRADERDRVSARHGAHAQLEQECARRRKPATRGSGNASGGPAEQTAGTDADDPARSRLDADRAAAAARRTSGPPAPRR